MNTAIKIFVLLGAGAFLASCSSYRYISENDVYMQVPTEINLEEDENDITSFNAFKARQKGAFDQEYQDPRINDRMFMNQIMLTNSYRPFGTSQYMFRNRPMAFHGMGFYDPFYNNHYRGFNSGIGFGMRGYGMHGMYGNGFNSPFGYGNPYGFGYDPFFNGGFYGNSFYGNGYHGGLANNNYNNSPNISQPTFYGHRGSMSSCSSFYSNSKSMQGTNSSGSYDINNQQLGTSRRAVQRKYAGGSDYNKGFNNNGVPNSNGMVPNANNRMNKAPVHHRAVNNRYTPNSSARRSGVVQESRRSGITGQPNRSGASPSNSGVSNQRPTRTVSPSSRTQQVQSRGRSYSTSPSSSGSSRNSSPSSTSRRR